MGIFIYGIFLRKSLTLYIFHRKFVEHDDNHSPRKGERVDSINYYREMLDRHNETVVEMQVEGRLVVDEGNQSARANEWVAKVISSTAGAAASSLVRIFVLSYFRYW